VRAGRKLPATTPRITATVNPLTAGTMLFTANETAVPTAAANTPGISRDSGFDVDARESGEGSAVVVTYSWSKKKC
jgi:hypothetical protein